MPMMRASSLPSSAWEEICICAWWPKVWKRESSSSFFESTAAQLVRVSISAYLCQPQNSDNCWGAQYLTGPPPDRQSARSLAVTAEFPEESNLWAQGNISGACLAAHPPTHLDLVGSQ